MSCSHDYPAITKSQQEKQPLSIPYQNDRNDCGTIADFGWENYLPCFLLVESKFLGAHPHFPIFLCCGITNLFLHEQVHLLDQHEFVLKSNPTRI